jgi:MacB-like periplasmic core domain
MAWANSKRFGRINMVAPADFVDWKTRNTVFEDLAYSSDNLYTITGAGEPVSVPAFQSSANFFALLGVKPLLGRTFRPDEEFVAILSYRLWQSHFGADARVIGRSITMDGKPYSIIGVMPREFVPFRQGSLATLSGPNWSGPIPRPTPTGACWRPPAGVLCRGPSGCSIVRKQCAGSAGASSASGFGRST